MSKPIPPTVNIDQKLLYDFDIDGLKKIMEENIKHDEKANSEDENENKTKNASNSGPHSRNSPGLRSSANNTGLGTKINSRTAYSLKSEEQELVSEVSDEEPHPLPTKRMTAFDQYQSSIKSR